MHKKFTKNLVNWSAKNPRDLPWKKDKNPYQIWLSEIILQQTRVAQGTPYYLRFVEAYPTVQHLAKAKEEDVLKLWQGLGYYSRARNLHTTAKIIVQEYEGRFPEDYKEILALKGIGPYTAAAITSFAFDQAYPVVDGNVLRVITRVFGITESIDESPAKKKVLDISQKNIAHTAPADYNQAIMDFGATHCLPRNPLCQNCVMQKFCVAFNERKVNELPKRTKKIKQTERYFNYLAISYKNKLLFKQRQPGDIWQGLFDFPVMESKAELRDQDIKADFITQFDTISLSKIDFLETKTYKQKLTHQKVNARIYSLKASTLRLKEKSMYRLVDRSIVHTLAVPKIIDLYLKERSII